MYRKKNQVIIFLLLLTLTVISCVKSSDLDDCVEQMRIELRWILTEPVDYDESVPIEVIPETVRSQYTITSDVYGVNVDLRVDEYTIVGYESAQNSTVDVNTQIVSIPTGPNGMALEPEIFSAGSNTVQVTLADKSLIIPLPMYRQVRPLIIEIEIEGDGSPLIQGITGVLHGIALERSISNGFPPTNGQNRPAAIRNGSIDYNLLPLTRTVGDSWFGGSRNLLGIDGTVNQILDLVITFTDGSSTTLSLDVTDDLSEFQTVDINEPWYIIIVLEAGFNLEVSIADWKAGAESWITAH